MVADKQSVGVDVIGVGQAAVNFVVKVLHHLVLGEIARHDRAAFKPVDSQTKCKFCIKTEPCMAYDKWEAVTLT